MNEKPKQTPAERKAIEDELRIDALTLGTSLALMRDDGSIERIPLGEYLKPAEDKRA